MRNKSKALAIFTFLIMLYSWLYVYARPYVYKYAREDMVIETIDNKLENYSCGNH